MSRAGLCIAVGGLTPAVKCDTVGDYSIAPVASAVGSAVCCLAKMDMHTPVILATTFGL